MAQEIDLQGRVDRHELILLGDPPRVVRVVDRPELDPRVLVQEGKELPGPHGAGRHGLTAVRALTCPGDHPALDEIDEALREELGVHAEFAMVVEKTEHVLGNRADADLQRGAVGDSLGHERCDPAVGVALRMGGNLEEGRVGLAPTDDLTDVDLVVAEGPRHVRIYLDEKGHPPDQGRGIAGLASEREVAVRIRRRDRRDR